MVMAIIIDKNISIVINEFSQDCGLTLLSPDHFKENTDTTHNFKQWKEKDYSFSLESIHQGKEFRRNKVLSEIKHKLEENKRLLLLGEPGTSKTTLMMETICDYIDKGYRVMYNMGDEELRNKNAITEKTKGSICWQQDFGCDRQCSQSKNVVDIQCNQ